MILLDYSEIRLEMAKYNNAILLCTDFGDIDWVFVILRGILLNQVTRDIIYIAYPEHLSPPDINFIEVVFIPVKYPILNEPPVVGKVPAKIYTAQLLRLVALDVIYKLDIANKVLYLDNDILLFGDVGVLFENDSPIMALHASDAGPQSNRTTGSYYFSGVMLFNVKQFYDDIGLDSLMDEFYRVYTPTAFVYADEEFLNTLITAEKLPRFYNHQVQFNKRIDKRIDNKTIILHFAWHKPKKQNLYYYTEYKESLMKLVLLLDPESNLYRDVSDLLMAIDNHLIVFGVSSSI